MKPWNLLTVLLCLSLLAILSTGTLQAQQDPGPRGDPAGAGGSFDSLNTDEKNFFNQALIRFQEVNSVSGTIEHGNGLGRLSMAIAVRCAMCIRPSAAAVRL